MTHYKVHAKCIMMKIFASTKFSIFFYEFSQEFYLICNLKLSFTKFINYKTSFYIKVSLYS